VEKTEYVEFIRKQEENFFEKFGEPLDKKELLFIARKVYIGQIEQYLKTQVYHLQGKRMLGFIKQMQDEIETSQLATDDEMSELLKGLEDEPETKQDSSKRNSRSPRPGTKSNLVLASSNTGGKPGSTPGS
jgi:hypothetical protein